MSQKGVANYWGRFSKNLPTKADESASASRGSGLHYTWRNSTIERFSLGVLSSFGACWKSAPLQ